MFSPQWKTKPHYTSELKTIFNNVLRKTGGSYVITSSFPSQWLITQHSLDSDLSNKMLENSCDSKIQTGNPITTIGYGGAVILPLVQIYMDMQLMESMEERAA